MYKKGENLKYEILSEWSTSAGFIYMGFMMMLIGVFFFFSAPFCALWAYFDEKRVSKDP